MIYAYGICEASSAEIAPRRRGLGGARLRAVRSDGLAAVYSRHRTLRPRPTRDAVLAHERVLEAIMERGPVLPLRFGTRLEAEDELAAVLSERREQLLRALERVRGRIELGVRALPADGGSRPEGTRRRGGEGSGREYLLARVEQHRDAERAARELHAPLAALAREARLEERAAAPAVFVASYLVDEAGIEAFRARAAELDADRTDLELVVTGPWPPYSFADEESS